MASKRKLAGLEKQCSNCQRTLSSRHFVYDQHSEDRLREACRTCESYRSGLPSLEEVEDFETVMRSILSKATQEVKDVTKYRTRFEQIVYQYMEDEKLLDAWKPPVWIHKTSIKLSEQHDC